MLISVVLSGGAGTRLWPVSREGYPKPFMKLADGESLLLKAYRRAAEVGATDILTVTNRDYYFMSKDEMAFAQTGCSAHFLLEPLSRNTAPAIALAAHLVAERHGHDALMLVLPADHLVQDQEAFAEAVFHARELAELGKLVTFGIAPTGPETGFGYIETGADIFQGKHVVRFIEKPSLEKAREYVESDRFLWNSGMFCFKAGVFLKELAEHASELSAAAVGCWKATVATVPAPLTTMVEIPTKCFVDLPDISVDYALMERSSNVAVVPGRFRWRDVGSWASMRDLTSPDENGNRVFGNAVFVGSRNVYVHGEHRLVAAVGVENIMVIDTPDAVLITHPDKVQEIKQVVSRLRQQGDETYKMHRKVMRPWGTYTVLEIGPRFKIKRIEVRPGASLSLQMHYHRSEHWIVVSGTAKVVNGDQEFLVNTDESTYIPAGHKHRLENPGVVDLVMIEVQSGEYLGEDDIVRFESGSSASI